MQSNTIECKPTMWFTRRAVLMTLLFLGFGVYFYYDASIGYPQKNLEFFMHKAFVDAGAVFDSEVRDKGASEEDWRRIVSESTVNIPEVYELPAEVGQDAIPWPDILKDYGLMSTPGKGWSAAWLSYSGEKQYPITPDEHPYDSSKIFEQWVAGTICVALGMVALFFLIRTHGRKMCLDGETVTASGIVFRVDDIARLDLRRWKLKGLAIATLKPECGGRRIRLDGFTYGGFREGDPSNAENFMQELLSLYKGEIIDYEEKSVDNEEKSDDTGDEPVWKEDEEPKV